ncbi:glutaredoxin domain-containing protein [Nocardiopsis sp. RSe5-2]|uniref:Glutaredoxin domain-containing protein n=1 Tax=Nocardiopsis endophytica TaxID=3018445 RepID=A0ABT4U8B5_9ACTN|nr:glutaredoxin domain-containing protein [Nocardiopsis endophytica]MDA2813194.1 glutaredoxin domain-containing protein [Nocardiopsis endophytica]
MTEHEGGTEAVMYWRPGCPFCYALRGGLRAAGVRLDEVNIWADDEAAARVRAITGGDETVPTVVVGRDEMVNPSVGAVVRAVREHAPHVEAERRGGVRGFFARVLGA